MNKKLTQLLTFAFLLTFAVSCKQEKGQNSLVEADSTRLVVGTYTQKEGHVDGKANGIYIIELDHVSQSLEMEDTITGLINPSFVALSADQRYAVAVNEIGRDFPEGWLSLIDMSSGEILDTLASGQFAPCHVTVDQGQVWWTNYAGGVIGRASIKNQKFENEEYLILSEERTSQHARQDGSHPHSSLTSTNAQYTYVADLGTDKLWIIDEVAWTTEGATYEPPYFKLPDGSGPRHMVLDPSSNQLYVLNELSNSVARFLINEGNGSLTLMEDLKSTLPNDFEGDNTSADIVLVADGLHLYTSNRGHNSITQLEINDSLQVRGNWSTQGLTPRNIMLTQDGRYLLVANQDSGDISVFSVGPDGQLVYKYQVKVPTPVCLVELN